MRIVKSAKTCVKAANYKVFDTHGGDSKLNKYSGQQVEVIRPLTSKEADLDDVGMMYKVRLPDGTIIDAFEDELVDDIDACGDIKASIDSDIARYKKALESKAAKSGIYENFGSAEIRKLRDKYSELPDDTTDYRTAEHNRNSISSFEDWCMNYVGANTSTDKALQHIKAAIDILGKSGNKDEITKDSIANLGVVMFDLQDRK